MTINRNKLAADILCAMLVGVASAQTSPLYLKEFAQGVLATPMLAVSLADKLIEELNKKGD